MKSRLKLVLFVLVSIFTIWWFGRPILENYRRGARLGTLKAAVESLDNKKEALIMEVGEIKSLKYVEKEARDRLFMVKEGERVVILPKETEAVLGEQAESTTNSGQHNWQQWKRLFFE